MIRTTTMAALALALMSSAAFAQADRPPAQLSGDQAYDDRGDNNPAYDDRSDNRSGSDDRDYDDRGAPPPSTQAQNGAAQDSSRDIYCRRSAAASTGYVTPGEAADHERTAGAIGGTLGGAALGAIIGGASHSAGPGALIGAGAGLIAGTAIGSDNARHAAADVQAAYSDAYYACMADRGGPPQPDRYAYGPPPPPAYYAPYPYPYPYYYGPAYYGPAYYGPAIRLNFGFGGHWGGRGFGGFHGHR
jgi:hypothetical protein